MDDAQLNMLDQVRDFLADTALMTFNVAGDDARRDRSVSAVLSRLGNSPLGKSDRAGSRSAIPTP